MATLAGSSLRVGRATAAADSRRRLLGDVSLADVVAIDAPLLPMCDSRDRSCEHLFARGQFQRRCKAGFSHVPGTGLRLRGAGFESAVQPEGITSLTPMAPSPLLVFSPRNIVEAFPNAFLGVCVSAERYASMPNLRRGGNSIGCTASGVGRGAFHYSRENWRPFSPSPFRQIASTIRITKSVQRWSASQQPHPLRRESTQLWASRLVATFSCHRGPFGPIGHEPSLTHSDGKTHRLQSGSTV